LAPLFETAGRVRAQRPAVADEQGAVRRRRDAPAQRFDGVEAAALEGRKQRLAFLALGDQARVALGADEIGAAERTRRIDAAVADPLNAQADAVRPAAGAPDRAQRENEPPAALIGCSDRPAGEQVE